MSSSLSSCTHSGRPSCASTGTFPTPIKSPSDSALPSQQPTVDRPKPKRWKSFSTRARNPGMFTVGTDPEGCPPSPPAVKPTSASRFQSFTGTRRLKESRDEMWEAYKQLESEHERFQSKSNTQRANILRNTVLPALREFKARPFSAIPPETLEKRAQILQRWWITLLKHLRSRNAHPALPGADRALYLECISLILSRPEWRADPSTFSPTSPKASSTKSGSSTSLSSNSSTFSIQKSVQHNIQMLFVQCLCDSLSLIVEKLSLRSVQPTLIAFSGKLTAYAFFFCPSVAEVLIGLWKLDASTLRRASSSFGVHTEVGSSTPDIASYFPEPVQHLAFSSLKKLLQLLKAHKKPPISIDADWSGPWLSRWTGRDSDLLFCFFKWYHILMCEFLPTDVAQSVRACSPGYVPVLAQMLALMDGAIHRTTTTCLPDTSSTTFEDLLNSSATLSVPVRTSWTMAENKLVMSLREVLFDPHCPRTAREIYASSFVAIFRAAAQRTKLYDADACSQLCDLFEGVGPVLVRVSEQGLGAYIDWPFWINILQTMLGSENNMTELRVISLVYMAWDILVKDDTRKKQIYIDWILSTDIWNRFFCHWCPMVRAYYMRLLCWRLARFNGSSNDVDIAILQTLLLRLRTAYANHLRLKQDYENGKGKPLSTAPCLPAPSRRLVILRNDTVASSQPVLLPEFASSPTPFTAAPGSLLHLQSTLSRTLPSQDVIPSDSSPTVVSTTDSEPGSYKRWNQIRSIFGLKPTAPEKPPRRLSVSSDSSINAPPDEEVKNMQANFRFSLEWMDKPTFSRERILGPSRLPGPAHRYLHSLGEDTQLGEISPASNGDQHWKYVGRALAEWILVVVECDSFFERRKSEGVLSDQDVETPSLNVEAIRKL